VRSIVLIESDPTTMLHVRHDGAVTVLDPDRESAIRMQCMDVPGDTTRRLLCVGAMQAENRLLWLDRLASSGARLFSPALVSLWSP